MTESMGSGSDTKSGPRTGTAWRWGAAVVLVVLTVAAFRPTLEAEFLNWDDPGNILRNHHYRGLGIEQVRWAFTTFHMGHYQPLSWLSLGLDYTIWKMNPFGYHLTNLLLHVGSALLVYWLAIRLYRLASRASPGGAGPSARSAPETGLAVGALAAACLFAVHPTRVESVAWITERRDVLSGLWYLATIHLYLTARGQARPAHRRSWTAAAVLAFVLALLAKVMSVSLVAVLLILDVYPLGRIGGRHGWLNADTRRVVQEKLPFAVPALVAAILAFLSQGESATLYPWAYHGLGPRLAVCAYGLLWYVYKMVWPLGLSPLYEMPGRVVPLGGRYLFCAALLLAGVAAWWMVRRRWPKAAAALAASSVAYLVILLPVLGLFQNGPQIVANRYSYLSCIGWALLVGAGWRLAWRRWAGWGTRLPMSLGGGAILGGLFWLTWQESRTWQNSISLWEQALEVDPECGFCHENLGAALVEEGRDAEAIAVFRDALKIRPNLETSMVGLAALLDKQGQYAEAEVLYRRALEVKPDYAAAHYNLAIFLTWMGKKEEAVGHYRQAIQHDPDDIRSYGNLGNLLSFLGRSDEAIDVYQRGLRVDPEAANIRRNLAVGLAAKGDFAAAAEHFRGALQANPDDPEALNNLGFCLAELGRMDEAARAYREALRRRPDYPRAHNNLGLLLLRMNRQAEAAEHFGDFLRLVPEFAEARAHLADLLVELGRCDEALALLREGLALAPGNGLLEEGQARASARCAGKDDSQAGQAGGGQGGMPGEGTNPPGDGKESE